MFKRTPSPREIAVAALVLAILMITLVPVGDRAPLPFSFELGVGHRWLADGILNLCLFVPFGLVVGWSLRSPMKAVLGGLLLSSLVEILQVWIPGRDPSLSDIIFNTVGAAVGGLLGLRPRLWLFPDTKDSVALTALAVALATLVMTTTVLVLQYVSRADAAGLDQPVYGLGAPGPTVGQGWTLLAYPDAIARSWGETLNAAWVLLLCMPIGFWARTRRSLAVAGVIALVLWWLPHVTAAAPTSLAEWIGAAAGLFSGAVLGRLSRRGSEGFLSEPRR